MGGRERARILHERPSDGRESRRSAADPRAGVHSAPWPRAALDRRASRGVADTAPCA